MDAGAVPSPHDSVLIQSSIDHGGSVVRRHQSNRNCQFLGPAQIVADILLEGFVMTEDGVINSAIEKLTQQLVQLEFPMEGHDVVCKSFPP